VFDGDVEDSPMARLPFLGKRFSHANRDGRKDLLTSTSVTIPEFGFTVRGDASQAIALDALALRPGQAL
jgi:hypothetical protein